MWTTQCPLSVRGTSAAPQSVHCLAILLRFSTSRPFRASRAPSFANRMLVPAPMPELAPVIRATLSFREDTYIHTHTHTHTHTHAHALKSLSAVHPVDSSPSTNEPIFNWDEFNYVQSVKVTRHRKIQGSNMTSCDRKLTYFKRVARCHDFCGVCARACASSTSDDAIWRVRLWSVVHTGLQHYSLLYSSKQNLYLLSFEAHIL